MAAYSFAKGAQSARLFAIKPGEVNRAGETADGPRQRFARRCQPDDDRRRKYGTRLFAVFGVARLYGAECRLAPVSGGPHAHERIAESRIADLCQHGAEAIVVKAGELQFL
jgi:hypothetical protein